MLNNLPVREVTALPVISAADENFYDLDLEGGPGAVAAPLQEESLPPPRRAAAALQPEDAEALFRRDPLSPSVAVLRSVRLPSDLAIDGGSAPTARHEQRAIESGGGFLPGAPLALRRVAAEPAEEAGRFTLGELLAGGILFAPSECQRADGPRFAVVPKTRELLSAAPLAAFRPLCRARLSRRDFRTLTTPRLAELRRQWATLAFDQLAFLCALVASDGRLRPELDPGGRFWRAGELPLDPSLPDETAILAAMAEPLRLNEIAARSARPMARVIDVVNALAAIGRLGSALRDRLR
ncbi:MAG: hypothetical protein RML12_04640 [Xanthomonadales bacterium]|nr:hypothetical protein [Xanthomonadales bacterium]